MSEEKMEFKAELKQVMDIIVHSLYSHREIFLRELVSNACDAVDRLRFDAIQQPELAGDDHEWGISLIANKQDNTLTIRDNGCGMAHGAVVENLGTIARSGTKNFMKQLQDADAKERPELIGQFGVGFYSAFMVAEKVTVITRAAGADVQAVRWECEGGSGYTLEDCEKETRGTDVILALREDAKEFLDEWRLREIVKKYSDFVEYPITLELVDEKGERPEVTNPVMNSMKALWLRSKDDVKPEEYAEFYKQIGHDFQDPLRTIHYAAEGTLEFKALLFVPAHRPFDFYFGDAKSGPSLYVQRVQIMDHCDKLLPKYLRFVKGVVDSSDLPLNVSREMLQHNAMLAKIQKNLVAKVLGELSTLKKKDMKKYREFYAEFGDVLKEGVAEDFANREKLADLLLFHSTNAAEDDTFVTLTKYVESMPEDQKEILYLAGEHLAALKNSPYLELFRSRGQEVLLLTSPMDEWAMESLHEYKDKKFKAVDKGEVDADEQDKEAVEESKKKYSGIMEFLTGKIDGVKEVRVSSRLKDSASCLVVDEQAMSAQMERVMKKMGQTMPESERILELNPAHPAVQKLQELYEANNEDVRVEQYGMLLYDEAVIAEGSRVKDPAAFAKRINALIAGE